MTMIVLLLVVSMILPCFRF